jgi:RNA polymerase sigma-70 factor (ECF subfamily)
MRLVTRGEQAAFEELARRYRGALLKVAESKLGRGSWAEDAVQEALLAAYRFSHTYDETYEFRTWLWTILLNQCKAQQQRLGRRAQFEVQPCLDDDSAGQVDALCEQPGPLAQLLVRERRERLDALLSHLSAAQADALRLRFFGGLKFEEIAATMGCSLSTAKNRVRWGLLRLSSLLAGDEPASTVEETAAEAERTTSNERGPSRGL